MYEVLERCRSCGGTELRQVLKLPDMPPADELVSRARLAAEERRFPLTLLFCAGCTLVQLRETVAPEILFDRDYPYFASFSEGWLRHNRANALELIADRGLSPASLVVEIACNDGYLLRNFHERSIPVLGIDPAPGPVAAARALGIPVLETFFTRDLAERLHAEGRRADLVLANNVLAHVKDLDGFVRGVARILKPDGAFVVEVPYLRDLVEHREFDTIYHEHLCYWNVTSLVPLFRARGLHLNDVRRLATHGGSLRLYVEKRPRESPAVARLLDEERAAGLASIEPYRELERSVVRVRDELTCLLAELKGRGKSIAAYGAAAKGATLLNACGIGTATLDFVVDRNSHKHGQFMPGVHLEILDPEVLLQRRPDYVLLLAWNHRREIERQQAAYLAGGGRFIVPVPRPEVV